MSSPHIEEDSEQAPIMTFNDLLGDDASESDDSPDVDESICLDDVEAEPKSSVIAEIADKKKTILDTKQIQMLQKQNSKKSKQQVYQP